MQFLEFIAQKIWPLIRNKTDLDVRCNLCLLSDKAISIHEDGICQECKKFTLSFDNLEENEKDLELDESKPYLVMLSGGKDSAYLLHKLVNLYPNTKFMPIMVDNGFMSKHAKENSINLCKKLNLDLIIHDELKPIFYEEFRKALLNLNGKPCYKEIDGVDGSVTFNGVSEYAAKIGVQDIITGLSREQLKRIFNLQYQHTYMDMNLNTVINPLALWNTNESKIRQYVIDNKLISEAGPLGTNSRLVLLMGILDIKNLGYSSFEPEFSSLIRNNKADRQYWLYMFEFLKWATKKGYLDSKANKILSEFGLTLNDVIK